MAETRKAYRNSRTDAVRMSTKPLGYPYVPVDADLGVVIAKASKADKADKASNGDDGGKGDS